MNTWKAILAALVIFGTGLVTGTVWTRVSEKTSPPAPVPATARPNGARTAQQSLPLEQLRKVDLMLRVQKELNLTPEQRVRIEKIITDGQGRIKDLWDQVAPEIYEEFKDVREKLCAELTPEQNELFNKLMKQQQHKGKSASTSAATNAAPSTVSQ